MKRLAVLVTAAVLGAGCTEGRLPPPDPESRGAPAKPVCDRMPAGVPEGFVLVRTKNYPNPQYVAVRREFRDSEERLLVYLLGITGEVGEGAPVAQKVTLADDTEATLVGGPVGNWAITWQDEFPCEQMAIVGNGFTRDDFEALMSEIGLLAPGPDAGTGYTEWIAVFDVARDPDQLDPSTEELLQTAGRDHIAVSPISCWEGLPEELNSGVDAYVAAVYGPGKAQLDEVIEAVGREPIFRGELVAYCID